MTSTLLNHLYQEELYQVPVPAIFVMDQPWDELAEADQLTLTKMIGALKLTIGSVQMLTLTNLKAEDLADLAPTRIVVLGTNFQSSSKQYEPITFDRNTFVVGDSVSKLDDARKKSLWQALKKMFNI